MLILHIKVLLKVLSHGIDAKKPGLLAKAITLRIIPQMWMVRLGELLMLQNVNVL